MLTSLDVHNRLQELDVPHELFKLPANVTTLRRAAASLGLEASQTARTEIYRAAGRLVMVVIPGDREVDFEKLSRATGASEISKVPDSEVPKITGYLCHALPPVAHREQLPAFIDYYTLREDVIYTGSGEPGAILKIRSYDLVRATGGETVDLVKSVD